MFEIHPEIILRSFTGSGNEALNDLNLCEMKHKVEMEVDQAKA